MVRTKIKTGRWSVSAEARAQRSGRCSTQGCTTKQSSWSNYAVKWAGCTVMDRECPTWQRATAWAVLAVYVLAMLGMTAVGVICFGAAFADNNTALATCLFIGLGLAVLLVPGLAVWRLISAILAGKVGATREEVAAIRVLRAERRAREWQRPLRTKIGAIVFAVVMYGAWYLHATHRDQHSHVRWVTPAMYAPFLLYGIWVQFRRPKERLRDQSGQDKGKCGDSSPSTSSGSE